MASESSPIDAAFGWIECAKTDDLDGMWSRLTSDFRTAIIQRWVLEDGVGESPDDATRDALVSALSGAAPEHVMWPYARDFIARFFAVITEVAKRDELGAGERPRPIAPGLEIVRLFRVADLKRDQNGNLVFSAEQLARNISMVMSQAQDGWAIAGIGDGVLQPGWPPVFQQLARPTD